MTKQLARNRCCLQDVTCIAWYVTRYVCQLYVCCLLRITCYFVKNKTAPLTSRWISTRPRCITTPLLSHLFLCHNHMSHYWHKQAKKQLKLKLRFNLHISGYITYEYNRRKITKNITDPDVLHLLLLHCCLCSVVLEEWCRVRSLPPLSSTTGPI